MKLIVALGNVGNKYSFTRHNAGFIVADKLALVENISFKDMSQKLKCYLTRFRYNNEEILLIKPTTFMNLSGEAVRSVLDYYKLTVNDLLVVYDDLSISLGTIRFRQDGSHGGHNGIKSIINSIGTQNFARVKIGIGPQPPIPAEAFVLQNFNQNELDTLKGVVRTVIDAIKYYFDNGIQQTQNKYN